MKTPRILAIVLTAALVAAFLFFGINPQFYSDAMLNAFYCVILGACAILLFALRPWSDLVPVLACTAGVALVDLVALKFPPAAFVLVPLISFFGLSCLFILGIRAIWAEPGRRGLLLCALIPGILFAVSEYSATTMLEITGRLHPKALDLYLYSFEGSLGVQFSFLLGQSFAKVPWWRTVNMLFYISLPIPMLTAYAGQLRRKGKAAVPVIVAMLIAGPLGILFFNLFPAGGPANMFRGGFPWHPLTMDQARRLLLEPISVGGWRNAIPSLHMTWVLLAWWNSKDLSRWARSLIAVFFILTVTSTMGTGEHWFIDLVVAFPFALMIEAVAKYDVALADRRRWLPLGAGLAMAVGWLALLRYATPLWWVAPLVPWALVVATIAWCIYLERQVTVEAAIEKHEAKPEVVPVG